MCGFAGTYYTSGNFLSSDTQTWVHAMVAVLRHRGPDDAGVWAEPSITLGHARLSILDLSPAGHQPMVSVDGQLVLSYNGEIYNHLNLRQILEKEDAAPAWRGHSDTETLLACFSVWGIEKTLKRAIGMFALALWNRKSKTLTLARDRLGEKPLYYGWVGGSGQGLFLFTSELKAMRRCPVFTATINRNALGLYLRHNYIPAPHTIYEGIFKLEAGSILTISHARAEPKLRRYWSAGEIALKNQRSIINLSPQEAVDACETILKQAIGRQMIADVPLGAFLSGGIDSSLVVALMQSLSHQPARTFTIGFQDDRYNEADYAKAIAAHLGTEHTELYVTPAEAMAVIPRLPTIYDEPFADASQIPTFLVSELARRHVTVSLSGDAGDELFCGYTRYQITKQLWGMLSRVPKPVRAWMARMMTTIPPGTWDHLALGKANTRLGDKLHKGAAVLASGSADDLYVGLISHWTEKDKVLADSTMPHSPVSDIAKALQSLGQVERMMTIDLLTYLPDDILVKMDRAAMAVGLETRVPMLDHTVVEFALGLAQEFKQRKQSSKWVLRQVLQRYVPETLFKRPKMGFGVPIDHWLRGGLHDWAQSLLDHDRLTREGFLNPAPIRQKWAEHLSGTRNWSYHLWNILMFQAWLDTQ